MMKRFITRIVLFVLPILILLAPPLYLMHISGELSDECEYFKPLDEHQLFGLAYRDINYRYKFVMTNEVMKPQVLALGSSRIMQVCRDAINANYTFYNAGGAINNIYDFELFVKKLDYNPRLIILNIDHFYFNPNFRDQHTAFDSLKYDKISTLDFWILLGNCKKVYQDILKGKIRIQKVLNNNGNIGIAAIENGNGFRIDGSYYYGGQINDPGSGPDYNFRDTYKRIDHKGARFEYCSYADTTIVDGMERFLADCEKRNITVIAIIPPFAPAINDKMNETGGYAYMSQIYNVLSTTFDKHAQCFLYDYTDMSAMGVHNYDFVDGFHGSDLIYNYILEDISRKEKTVSGFFVDSLEFSRLNKEYISKNIKYHDL